jgi:hypothetical protein
MRRQRKEHAAMASEVQREKLTFIAMKYMKNFAAMPESLAIIEANLGQLLGF